MKTRPEKAKAIYIDTRQSAGMYSDVVKFAHDAREGGGKHKFGSAGLVAVQIIRESKVFKAWKRAQADEASP